MAVRERQALLAGSYSSTVPTEKCGRAGWTAASFGPVTAPPMTYILSPTVTATGEPRFVGRGASARQVSRAGSYSQALSSGTHAAGPDRGSTKPPKPTPFPLYSLEATW